MSDEHPIVLSSAFVEIVCTRFLLVSISGSRKIPTWLPASNSLS
jgi:hypothetical protein